MIKRIAAIYCMAQFLFINSSDQQAQQTSPVLLEKCTHVTLADKKETIPCREKAQRMKDELDQQEAQLEERNVFQKVLHWFTNPSNVTWWLKKNLKADGNTNKMINNTISALILSQNARNLEQSEAFIRSENGEYYYKVEESVKNAILSPSNKTLTEQYDYARIMYQAILNKELAKRHAALFAEEDKLPNFKNDLEQHRAELSKQQQVGSQSTETTPQAN